MLNRANTRELYEQFCNKDAHHNGVTGRQGFVNLVHGLVGLGSAPNGNRIVESEPQLKPSDINLRELAYATMGVDAEEILAGSGRYKQSALLEDADAAIFPGHFLNINAWSAATAGLLEAQILAQFNRPEFIADKLAATRPTKLRQDKIIGISDLKDDAELMNPGQRHPRTQVEERYVETPETKKRGLALDVTKEAVFFDRTTQLLDTAGKIGMALALRKERLVSDTFIGVNNTWKYKGTTANTYTTSGNRINDQSNPLRDWENVDSSQRLFINMVDEENEEPIAIIARDLMVMPHREMIARQILSATTVQTNTQADTERRTGANPLAGMGFNLFPASVYLYGRMIASDGLNLSAANAQEYWFHGDFMRAFAWMENWGMEVEQASPDSYTARDKGLIMSIFANFMGEIAVIEPQSVARNKN